MLKKLYPLLFIALVGLAAYSNTFTVPFQFDDFGNITESPVVKNLDNFISSSKGYEFNPRRYIGHLTFALNYRFGGLDTTGYHIVNLAVHIANALLVYVLVMLTMQAISNQHSAISTQQSAMATEAGKGQGAIGNGNKGRQEAPPIAYDLSPSVPPFTFHDSRFIALFSALLFVSHPIQTQAVTYIVQRLTSLATLFYLLSVVMYIKGRLVIQATGNGREAIGEETQKATDDERWAVGRPIAYSLLPVAYFFSSLACAVLAMKTKEIAFTLPIIIVLYEFTFFTSSIKKKLLFLLPVVLTLIVVPLSVMGTGRPLGEILSDLSDKTRVQTDIPRLDYFLTELRVITTYIRLIFVPVNQNLDYDYPISHSFLTPSVFLSFLFLFFLLGLAGCLLFKSRQSAIGNRQSAKKHEKQPAISNGQEADLSPITYSLLPIANGLSPVATYYRLISFGILWFFVTLSVESSVIPIADVIFEHRAYLPSVGAFISITAAFFLFAGKLSSRWDAAGKAVVPAFVIVVIGLAGATYARNTVWQDDFTLWQDVVGKSPRNARAHNDFGYICLNRGMIDRAIEHFQAALRLNPYYADAHTNLGVAYYSQGSYYKAAEQFRVALKFTTYRPDIPNAHHNLGLAYSRIGLTDDAIRELESAAALEPGDAEVLNDLGVLYQAKGFSGKAIESYQDALKVMPGNAGAHYNLGRAYESLGRHDLAAGHFSEAHRLSPDRF